MDRSEVRAGRVLSFVLNLLDVQVSVVQSRGSIPT